MALKKPVAAMAVLLVLPILMAASWASAAAAAAPEVYNVGGAQDGWSLKADLKAWAQQYTFRVGDSLFFNYSQGAHTVLQVNKEDYQACNIAPKNVLFADDKGNTMFPLAMAGKYWFICGIPNHCAKGMKLAITVVNDETTYTWAPTPSPIPWSSNAIMLLDSKLVQVLLLALGLMLTLF